MDQERQQSADRTERAAVHTHTANELGIDLGATSRGAGLSLHIYPITAEQIAVVRLLPPAGHVLVDVMWFEFAAYEAPRKAMQGKPNKQIRHWARVLQDLGFRRQCVTAADVVMPRFWKEGVEVLIPLDGVDEYVVAIQGLAAGFPMTAFVADDGSPPSALELLWVEALTGNSLTAVTALHDALVAAACPPELPPRVKAEIRGALCFADYLATDAASPGIYPTRELHWLRARLVAMTCEPALWLPAMQFARFPLTAPQGESPSFFAVQTQELLSGFLQRVEQRYAALYPPAGTLL